jgi:PII-like signaling protein
MNGFQVTFFTGEGRHHGHKPMGHWLMDTIKSLGITGATMTVGVEGFGRDGKLHSAHFFELADQPVEVTVAVNEAQCEQLFARLEQEGANVFYLNP